MQGGELYIYNLSDDAAAIDTLTIQSGHFQYSGEAKETTPYMLVFPNGMDQVIFANPGADLTYEASANDLKNYRVEGSEENQLMNKFRQDTYSQNPSTMTGTARTYILEHPDSPVAIYLLDKYFVQNEQASNIETAELLQTVKKHHPHSHYLLDIENQINLAEKGQVGATLPNVVLTKEDKTTTTLWEQTAPFNLIAFWAEWLPNGYDVLWKLRQTNSKYKETDSLRIVAISLDIQRYRWGNAIHPDTVNGIEHYCDGLAFESKALRALGVNEAPLYYLADKNHKIIERSTDMQAIDKMLEKDLKKDNP